MPTVALGSDFLDAYARIPRAQQKKVREFTEKFKVNPKSPGINYGRWLSLSSASPTEYAFTINMELGVLVTDGKLPEQVQEHFDRLAGTGVLAGVLRTALDL
jgi:hypothetical protein